MKNTTKRVIALAGVLALGLSAAKAQEDGALLDALVKKGVLSDQEAQNIRASEEKENSTTAADKIAISDYVQKIRFYGDVRFRYEYLDETPQSGKPITTATAPIVADYSHDNVLERYRYRLRAGVDFTFTDHFMGGFELESNTAGDSANQSFGNGFSKESANIGLVYLQWKPTDWLTLVGGKQKNPLYTTNLTWDPDINPEGGAEILNWTIPIGGSDSVATTRDPKDMKSIVAPSGGSDESLSIGLTAAQWIYADNQEYNTDLTAPTVGTPSPAVPSHNNNTDVWQFVEQVPVQFNFNKTTFIKVSPGFDSYMSGGNSGIPSSFTNGTAGDTGWTGGSTLNFAGPNIADHLEIFQAPGEFDWKMVNIPFKIYWDFDLNTDGKARVQDVLFGNGNAAGLAGGNGTTYPAGTAAPTAIQNENRALGDNVAWLAGVQVGQNKKKGDWSGSVDYRQVGLGAIDPNENDSDWSDSFLNMQGLQIRATYNFTDFLTGSITYYDDWVYKKGLLDGSTPGQGKGAGTIGGLPLAGGPGYAVGNATTNPGGANTGLGTLVGANAVQRVDVDLQWKF